MQENPKLIFSVDHLNSLLCKAKQLDEDRNEVSFFRKIIFVNKNGVFNIEFKHLDRNMKLKAY